MKFSVREEQSGNSGGQQQTEWQDSGGWPYVLGTKLSGVLNGMASVDELSTRETARCVPYSCAGQSQ